jgi:peptidoglycan/xylan/chitin deacetylase (PgdA/CDA1 family)
MNTRASVALLLVVAAAVSGGCRRRDGPPGQVGDYWARALEEAYRSPDELQAQNRREARKGIVYRKLIRGNPRVRAVALTFDDGPHPDHTPRLLAILREHHVRATFFVVGRMAEQYPDLIRREQAEGHLLANHTYHHANLVRIPDNLVEAEWQACNNVVEGITGYRMTYCRPPGGDYDAGVIKAATDVGLTTVLWTDDPGDYAQPGDTVIEQRVLEHITPGGIILLHDGVQQTLDVLPQILDWLQHRGFACRTIDELAQGLGSR